MEENTALLSELEKEKMIKKELDKIKRKFKNIPKDKFEFYLGLMEEAAYMKVSLIELKMITNRNGQVEWFEQGTQKMWRESPAAKTYNQLIKNYQSTLKQLEGLLPDTSKADDDELIKFLKTR